jgi:hypothetical protein
LTWAVIRHAATALGWDDFYAKLPQMVRGYAQVFASARTAHREDGRMLDEEQGISHIIAATSVGHALHQAQRVVVRDSPHANEMNWFVRSQR